MKFRSYINWIALLACLPTAQAQEEKHLDAHPQDVYNAITTLFTTQENIQYNQKGYKAIADDLSISGMHRFTFVQQHGNKLQNLGNNGTAAKPIFYVIPENIGVTSGFHAYDIYFRSPGQFRYYDTKSPYSKLYVILARFGSFYADVCHSRNVTPNWNIGANFRNMMTDKEWIPRRLGDRNVISYGFDLFTHYNTDNEQYQLLAHLLIAKHRVRETGGIYTEKYQRNPHSMSERTLWTRNMANRFWCSDPKKDPEKDPESSDARKRFHLYHQLALAEQLWVYHELGICKDKHQFKKNFLIGDTGVCLGGNKTDTQKAIDTAATLWNAQNEWGVKGDWQNWFYCGYYRHKKLEFRPQQEENNQDLHEVSAGR
jgi:Putative porin